MALHKEKTVLALHNGFHDFDFERGTVRRCRKFAEGEEGQMTGDRIVKWLRSAAIIAAGITTAAGSASAETKKYQVYLSISYVGNGWQSEATNMVSAMAKYYGDQMDFHVQVAGPVVQRQIQQINSMVQAGANAIILYPISPTALNGAIKSACEKGVVIFAYDSTVTEPCAYIVHPDQYQLAATGAEWVAKTIGYKGDILLVTGVPGTTVDTSRNRAYRDVVAKYPGMKIVGEVNGMWSLAVIEKVITEFMATHKWTDIDGILGSGGGWTAWQQEVSAGVKKLTPYATDGANATRVAMLPVGSIPDATPPYAPMGAPGISLESTPMSGALALKLALKVLGGDKTVPKDITIPLQIVTSENIKLCKEGTWKEMRDGCNVFDPKVINTDYVDNIFSPETPELGLKAAMFGEPEPKE
jgi:ribose transport system substrate-binding protein